VSDFDATILSPSAPIDAAWHNHILDTKNYINDCIQYFGQIIHHNPAGAKDTFMKRRRYEKTLEEYVHFFKEFPPRQIWPRLSPVRGHC